MACAGCAGLCLSPQPLRAIMELSRTRTLASSPFRKLSDVERFQIARWRTHFRLVVEHGGRSRLGDDPPLVHDVTALRHGADHIDVLFDKDDGQARLARLSSTTMRAMSCTMDWAECLPRARRAEMQGRLRPASTLPDCELLLLPARDACRPPAGVQFARAMVGK